MRNRLKYIMYDMQGAAIPVIFAPVLSHKDMHDHVFHLLRRKYRLEVKLVSAGFLDPSSGATSGESESLKMSSRPEDGALIDSQPSYLPAVDAAYNWR